MAIIPVPAKMQKEGSSCFSQLKIVFALLSLLVCYPVFAETFFEISASVGQRQLDIFRKLAPQVEDDANFMGLAIAAYRKTGDKSAWGGVIETLQPLSRDITSGSGKIIGIRPVNYWYAWTDSFSTEIYFGAAQYSWLENASGYYWGSNIRYSLNNTQRYVIALDYKYFQDLAHDGGPGGDQIVDGPSLAMNFHYRFGH
jgi:hypothetical protein